MTNSKTHIRLGYHTSEEMKMLIQRLFADMIAARKGNDPVAKSLLVTLYSEAAMVGKNKRNGDTTDDEVVSVIKKFASNVDETIRHLEEISRDSEQQRRELDILNSYLPKQMSEGELVQAIRDIVEVLGVSGPKAMGAVMAELKKQYSGQYDGKIASNIVKSILV